MEAHCIRALVRVIEICDPRISNLEANRLLGLCAEPVVLSLEFQRDEVVPAAHEQWPQSIFVAPFSLPLNGRSWNFISVRPGLNGLVRTLLPFTVGDCFRTTPGQYHAYAFWVSR